MSVKLYCDVHVRRAVTVGLRIRGVDVLTAQEDAAGHLDDVALLNRASELGRLLFRLGRGPVAGSDTSPGIRKNIRWRDLCPPT